MGKNILIFSDGTGQAGGYMPDETRSNVYKLFRATRVSPDTSIDPSQQFASRRRRSVRAPRGVAIRINWWRRIYNFRVRRSRPRHHAEHHRLLCGIIRVWQPGDRIYLFGFSRGAYTVRCVAGVLKYCGVPTAVVCQDTGRIRPLQRDLKSARRMATEAVKRVYQHGSSVKRDPYRAEREALAHAFRAKYCCGDTETSNTTPYFIGVWDTVGTLGAGSFVLALLAGLYVAGAAATAGLFTLAFGWPFQPLLAAFALGVPTGL